MQKYNTYMEEQRDDVPCHRGGDTTTTPSTPSTSSIPKTDIGVWGTLFSPEKSVPSCQSNYMIPDDGMTTPTTTTSTVGVPSYGNTREEDNKGVNHHSFGNMSKGMIRTFQTTVQNNTRSEQMMPENNPISPKLQSRLSRAAMETSRIANAVQHSAIVDGVSDKLSSVNDKLGSVMRSGTASLSSLTSRAAGGGETKLYNTSCSDSGSDRGIYNTPPRTWGSTVSASEVVNTSAQKVMNVFKRQNTYPVFGDGHAENIDSSNMKGAKEVSFDYQLMKDNE